MSFKQKENCRPGRAIALTRRHVGDWFQEEAQPRRPPVRYRDRLAREARRDDGQTGVTSRRLHDHTEKASPDWAFFKTCRNWQVLPSPSIR